MPDHLVTEFEEELTAIRTRALAMGDSVRAMMDGACEGISANDASILNEVLQREKLVNQMEVEIDGACSQVLARRQPAAADMRFVVTTIKLVRDLERIGDEAEKIARIGLRMMHDGNRFVFGSFIDEMHMHVTAMLRRALDGYGGRDASAFRHIQQEDIGVDGLFRSAVRVLIIEMVEDSRRITNGIEMLFVVKALERIGDHAKNISEHVVYMVDGRDVRLDREIFREDE